MSRTLSRHLLGQSGLNSFIHIESLSSVIKSAKSPRYLSSTAKRTADSPKDSWASTVPHSRLGVNTSKATPRHARSPSLHPRATLDLKGQITKSTLDDLGNFLKQSQGQREGDRAGFDSKDDFDGFSLMSRKPKVDRAWQMHIYASRQNTHITVCRPPAFTHPITGKQYGTSNSPHRTVALSYSTGNLGFRKAGRKHHDSAFQLAVYVLTRMRESGMAAMIEELEISLRGFGPGRQAVSSSLLGTEGKMLRHKVTQVSDATRLKFGGTRSPKPRRLG